MTSTAHANAKTVNSLFDLVSSMRHRRTIDVADGSGNRHIGIVNRIEVEDGSGQKYNVTLDTQRTIFCFAE